MLPCDMICGNDVQVVRPMPRFIYLGFYVAFNTVQVISRRVV